MQAYACAQPAPLESEPQQALVPSIKPTFVAAFNATAVAEVDSASPVSVLVSAIVDGLSDRDLGVLARRLLPHLRQPKELNDGRSAYTVASLAAELGVSQKAIRCAISRRELVAVKRGARWLISTQAVRDWVSPAEARSRSRRVRLAAAPRAAGPSLRSVLCAAASPGGQR